MERKYAIRIGNSKTNLDELHFTTQNSFSFAASVAYNLCFSKIGDTGESWRVVEIIESFDYNNNKKENK